MNNKKERNKATSSSGNKSKKKPVLNHQAQFSQNKVSKAKAKKSVLTGKKLLPQSGKKSTSSINLQKANASKIVNGSLTKENKKGKKDQVSQVVTNHDTEQVSPKKRPKGRPPFKHKIDQSKSPHEVATSHLIPSTSKRNTKVNKAKSTVNSSSKSAKQLTTAKLDKSKQKNVKNNKELTVSSRDKVVSKSPESSKKTTAKANEKRGLQDGGVAKVKHGAVQVKQQKGKIQLKDESTSVKNKTKRPVNSNSKPVNKSKSKASSQPTFPKRRGHRVASLNAIAKVKLLCENDRDTSTTTSKNRVSGETNQETSKKATLNTSSKSTGKETKKSNEKGTKPELKSKSKKVVPTNKKSIIKTGKKKVVDKKQKKKKKKKVIRMRPLVDPNVEIIDTRRCKRMASLNASAMMAATYLPEVRNDRQLVPVTSREPSRPVDPLAAINETIDEVVRQWCSTVEHLELPPTCSHSGSECKTTVKTTVKHVKLSHNNTVVETISTQIEQQGILPESSDLSARTTGGRSTLLNQSRGVTNHISASSSSAFTPCSSSCLQSTSHNPLMPNSQHSFSDTPTLNMPPVSSSGTLKKSKKHAKHNQHKHNTELPQSSNQSSSFIQKYELKTIETRMQSGNDAGHVHNSTVSNSIIVTNNTPGPNSIFNFNSAASALAQNNHLMPYSMYNSVPFQLIPLSNTNQVASQFQQQVPSLSPFIASGDPNGPVNYINLNAPMMQCQSMSANPYAATNTLAMPFVQLANPNQSQDFNHPLYGLSYINPAANSAAIFNSANPIINVLSNSNNSAATLLHRPIPFHPQSGQFASTIPSSQLLNSSNVMTSPVMGGLTTPIQSNMFNYPFIRPPAMNSTLQSMNLPMTSFSQPTILLPNSVNETTLSNPANHSQQVSQQFSVVQPTAPVIDSINHTTKLNSGVPRSLEEGSQSIATGSDLDNHPGEMANMTHQNEQQTGSTSHNNASIAKNPSAHKNKNRIKKLVAPHDNIVFQDQKLTNGKDNLIGKLKRPKLNPPNGIIHNPTIELSLDKKKAKITKSVSTALQNGSKNGLKKPIRPVLNKPVKQNKLSPPSEKSVSQSSLPGPSPISSSRILSFPNSNGLKKNKRPIVHGWSWEGQSFEANIYINNDDQSYLRKCYPAIKHNEGEVIRVRDCVLLKSGTRKNDLPFVAKITSLWESPEKEMMMSLLWYYRPEHTDVQESYITGEIYASRHRDANSVACIDDKCYVLTYNEYCRYKRQRAHMLQTANIQQDRSQLVVPPDPSGITPRNDRLPPMNTLPELVFCCRKVYDFRQKRILKNPY